MKYIVLFIILGLAVLVGMSEPEREVDQTLATYCEMVKLHKESPNDPGIGWPGFKGIYSRDCIKTIDLTSGR